MKKTILTSLGITLAVTLLVAFYILNLPGITDLNAEQSLGATITNIAGTDKLKDSRAVINTNFTNLNADKIETSTTTLPNITTLASLSTVGTIGTGIWNGTAIGVAYNGTGTSSPTSKQLMIGNGSSGFQVIGFGTNNYSLVSNGDGVLPSWQSVSFDTTANQTLTGLWTFQATTTMATTTIEDLTVSGNTSLNTGTISTAASSGTDIVNKDYFDGQKTFLEMYSHTQISAGAGTGEFTVFEECSLSAMGINDSLHLVFGGSTNGGSGTLTWKTYFGNGVATSTVVNRALAYNTDIHSFNVFIGNNNSTSAQKTLYQALQAGNSAMSTIASTIDTSSQYCLRISMQSSASATNNFEYLDVIRNRP